MTDKRAEAAQRMASDVNKKYGKETGFAGVSPKQLGVVPSGSLMFDYMSGIGGHPKGACVEVFGPPEIGKTAMMGYGVIRNAQVMGLLTGMICLEPSYDEAWVRKNGINPDYNVVVFPNNLDEAFEVYHDWVNDGTIDYILFDSVTGASTEADQVAGANARPGGLAKTITWNLQRTVTPAYKNEVGTMFINQVRDDQKSRITGLLDSPGGWALRHFAMNRIQIKPGANRFNGKIDGEDRLIGREIIAHFKKGKSGGSLGANAKFDYYWKEAEGSPFGIDVAKDVVATAKLTGVIKASGAWLYHELFPGGKLQGMPAVTEWIRENDDKVGIIRNQVLGQMIKERSKQRPELKVVEGG